MARLMGNIDQERNGMNDTLWSREVWDASVSTGHNSDWWATLTPEKEPELWAELKSIFEEEQAISSDIPNSTRGFDHGK